MKNYDRPLTVISSLILALSFDVLSYLGTYLTHIYYIPQERDISADTKLLQLYQTRLRDLSISKPEESAVLYSEEMHKEFLNLPSACYKEEARPTLDTGLRANVQG